MMDKAFLEFWGNVFQNAAKGRNQMDDFTEMMKGATSCSQDMDELFRKFSDPEVIKQNAEEYFKVCRKAGEDFQDSMKELLSLMDLVPKKDYDEIKKKYDDLLKSIKEKQEPLGAGILNEEMKIQADGMKVFEGLLMDQARQFQNLMSGFSKSSAQTEGSGSRAAPEAGKKKASGTKKKTPSAGRAKTRK
jgi:hypothetical protein